MPAIALVACAAGKRASPAPARDLYTSALFTKARAHVEARDFDSWLILSALHGLVDPGAVLEPYNVTLSTMPRAMRLAWGERVAAQIVTAMPAGASLVLFAGSAYRDPLLPHLSAYRVSAPLAGLGIGQQLAWFVHQQRTQQELPL